MFLSKGKYQTSTRFGLQKLIVEILILANTKKHQWVQTSENKEKQIVENNHENIFFLIFNYKQYLVSNNVYRVLAAALVQDLCWLVLSTSGGPRNSRTFYMRIRLFAVTKYVPKLKIRGILGVSPSLIRDFLL